MWGRTLAAGILALVMAPGSLLAGQQATDLQLYHQVAQEVRRSPDFTIFDDVNIRIESGVVTLTGDVTRPSKRSDLQRRVTRIEGVREVRNQLQVLPASSYDDELRYRIARAIYGHPTFWGYAAQASPPIHVIVDRGHVRLTGVVRNDVERMLARSIAGTLGAFSLTSELRTDAEVDEQFDEMTRASRGGERR
jgi:hyperosmotically inducible periplasmic protein